MARMDEFAHSIVRWLTGRTVMGRPESHLSDHDQLALAGSGGMRQTKREGFCYYSAALRKVPEKLKVPP